MFRIVLAVGLSYKILISLCFLYYFVKNDSFFKILSVCLSVCVCVRALSHVRLFSAPWTVAQQAPLSMEFSRQEYWGGLPFPTSGDLPNPRTEPVSLESPALAGEFFTTEPPGKPN